MDRQLSDLKVRGDQGSLLRALTLALLSLLIFLIPFEVRYQVLRKFSRSLFERFELAAPFFFAVPGVFDRMIHYYFSDLLIVAVLGLLFFSKSARSILEGGRLRGLVIGRHTSFLTLFFIAALLSILFSVSMRYYYLYFSLVNLALPLFAFSLIYQVLKGRHRQLKWICLALLIIAGFESAVGIGQFIAQKSLGLSYLGEPKLSIDPSNHFSSAIPLPNRDHPLLKIFPFIDLTGKLALLRANGTFPYANHLGGFLLLSLFLSNFFFVSTRRRWQKGGVAVLIFAQIFALGVTFCRAAIFGYLIGSVLFFGIALARKNVLFSSSRRSFLTLSAVVVTGLIAALVVLYPFLIARKGVISNLKGVEGDQWRLESQKIGFEMFLTRPITGVGYHCFTFCPGQFPSAKGEFPRNENIHNIYCIILAETGLLGALPFAFFLCSIGIGACRNLSPFSLSLLAAFVGFLFIGVCDLYFLLNQDGRILFFSTAGLLAAASEKGVAKQMN